MNDSYKISWNKKSNAFSLLIEDVIKQLGALQKEDQILKNTHN